jgi:hypothetical protein
VQNVCARQLHPGAKVVVFRVVGLETRENALIEAYPGANTPAVGREGVRVTDSGTSSFELQRAVFNPATGFPRCDAESCRVCRSSASQ